MFRNVYWHHAVRAATAVYKRAVQEAIGGGLVSAAELVGQTDEGVLGLLEARASARGGESGESLLRRWLPALRYRRLPKRVVEMSGEAVRDLPLVEALRRQPELRSALEERLARDLGLPPGSVFVDYPEKPRMMGLDLLLLQRSGETVRLPESGSAGLIDLPRVADELYHSARAFRVFATERRPLDPSALLRVLRRSGNELEDLLRSPAPIL